MKSEMIYSSGSVPPWPDPKGDEALKMAGLRRHIRRLEDLIADALSEQMPITATTRHGEVTDWHGVANLLKFARSVESMEANASALDYAPPLYSALEVMDERMSLISSRFTGAMVVFQFAFSALENLVSLCDLAHPPASRRWDLADRVPPHLRAATHFAIAMPSFMEIADRFEKAVAKVPSCRVEIPEGAMPADLVVTAFDRCRRWRNLLAHGRVELPASLPGLEEQEDFAEAEELIVRFHLATRLTLLFIQLLVLRCVEGEGHLVGEAFGAEALYDDERVISVEQRLLSLHIA